MAWLLQASPSSTARRLRQTGDYEVIEVWDWLGCHWSKDTEP
jgi:hypothetical protein